MTTLKEAARARGLRFGAAHDSKWPFSTSPKPYQDLFNAHCELLAPNLGWKVTTPNAPSPDPLNTDPCIASLPNCPLTGAHLVWHEHIPTWATTITDPAAFQSVINSHIAGMAVKYQNAFSWNVVNEVFHPEDGMPEGLRNTQFLKVLGSNFIEQAFIAAKAAMPSGPLMVINDYRLEENSAYAATKRKVLLNKVVKMKTGNVPVEAVGLQGHLSLSMAFDATVYRQFLSALSGLGLKILITELDVDDTSFVGTVAERDRATAYLLAEFLSATLDNKSVVSVVTWDIADRYSWLIGRSKRADGMEQRPLLFDYMFQPKPAFDMVLAAINAAPTR